MKKIQANKDKLMEYIKQTVIEKGFPPTVREMMAFLNVKSTCTVQYYLVQLEKENKLKRDKCKNRALEIVDFKIEQKNNNKTTSDAFTNVPLLGRVAAGEPIMAINNYEDDFDLPNKLFGSGEMFMLKVRGDSMIDAGILEDDYIVVKKQEIANNGEIIVAMHEGHVTVKTFYKEKDRIRLQPENYSLMPIYLKNVDILGKVVGVIRKY